MFQSRYRAASHFRSFQSRHPRYTSSPSFQSRYRAASHFRLVFLRRGNRFLVGFNLVIERLLISGIRHIGNSYPRFFVVSISLSSGFSFQDISMLLAPSSSLSVSISLSSGFSFQVASSVRTGQVIVVFQSRYRAASHFRQRKQSTNTCVRFSVSISLSSGFSFQVMVRLAMELTRC